MPLSQSPEGDLHDHHQLDQWLNVVNCPPNKKIQQRILDFLVETNKDDNAESDKKQITDKDHGRILMLLKEGFISDEEIEKFVTLDEAEKDNSRYSEIIRRIKKDIILKELLAHILGKNDFWLHDVTSYDVVRIFNRYPSPLALEARLRELSGGFLDKWPRYSSRINKFMRIFYGDRFEYHQQIKLLKKQAEDYQPANTVYDDPDKTPVVSESLEVYLDRSRKAAENIVRLTPAFSREVTQPAIIIPPPEAKRPDLSSDAFQDKDDEFSVDDFVEINPAKPGTPDNPIVLDKPKDNNVFPVSSSAQEAVVLPIRPKPKKTPPPLPKPKKKGPPPMPKFRSQRITQVVDDGDIVSMEDDLDAESATEKPRPIDPKDKAVVPEAYTIKSSPSLSTVLDSAEREAGLDQKFAEVKTSFEVEILDLNLDDFAEYDLTPIAADDLKKVMESSEIHASPYFGKELTLDLIRQENLQPVHKLEAGKLKAYLSPIYNAGGKFNILAYVADGEKFIIRMIYLSGSHCIWKQLPYYENFVGRIRYGKGRGQDSILADLPYQWAIAIISQVQNEALKVQNEDLLTMGTAKNGPMEYVNGGKITYYGQVTEEPVRLEGNFYKGNSDENKLTPPEEMHFDEGSAQIPDFSLRIKNWKAPSKIYGEINIDVFLSLNKQLTYVFCRDKEGRAWLAGIYCVNSPHTSTGSRRGWVDAGDLTTPGVTYPKVVDWLKRVQYIGEDGGYGGKRVDQYVDMFERYLSKVPVIQAYLRWVKRKEIEEKKSINPRDTLHYSKRNGLIK